MAMKPPVYYATLIVGANPAALPFMTGLVAQLQQMIKDATVAVPGTGLAAPAGGGAVTGAATGTIT